jgi:hypothetical protein
MPVYPGAFAKHQHVDHLAGGLGGPDLRFDRPPQLIEALGPAALLALLAQRQRGPQRPGLALKQLQVVVKPGADAIATQHAWMAGDLPPVVADNDLPRPDPGGDPEPGERDRCSKLSNGSFGNGRSNSISSDSAWPIVTSRPRIVRDRSSIMHTAR